MPGTPNWDEYCQLKITLIPQTPLILFQNQPGATLRATEVKPKLDKYLYLFIDRMSLEEKEELKNDRFFQGDEKNPWETKEALNYKMAIRISPQYRNKRPDEFPGMDPKRYGQARKYPCFYGADGSKDENFRPHYCYAVDNVGQANYPEVEVSITCFSAKGRKLIDRRLDDFFLTSNFGLRQNKGFGSFVPERSILRNPKRYAQKLMERLDSKVCLYVDLNGLSVEEKFQWIDFFSRILKSGINYPRNSKFYIRSFLFRYMHEKEIGNEKAWMKEKNILPCCPKNGHKPRTNEGHIAKFVRAPLGFSQNLTVRNRDICITPCDNSSISRFPSHLFFKVIDKYVFITSISINDNLWGKPIKFSCKPKGEHAFEEALDTPAKGEFDINELLVSFLCYLNPMEGVRNNIPKFKDDFQKDKGGYEKIFYGRKRSIFDKLSEVQIDYRTNEPNAE